MPKKPRDEPKGLTPNSEVNRPFSVVRRDLQEVIRDWTEQLSPNTRRAYDRAVKDFANHIGVSSAREAAASLFSLELSQANVTVYRFRNALKKKPLKPSTVNLKLSAILALNKVGRMAGFVSWTLEVPLLKVETYRDTKGIGAELVEPALRKLEESQGVFAARDLAVLTLIYRQGLRRGEVAGLDLEHIDLERSRLWVLGKGRSEREEVTLTPRTVSALKKWISQRQAIPGPLFPSMDRAHRGGRLTGNSIWRIVKGYNLGRPHGMRHTAISQVLIRSKGNILAAQQFARHRDPKVTLRYWDKIRDLGGEAAKLLDEDSEGDQSGTSKTR